MIELYILLALMAVGAIIALETHDLISAVISLGVCGFSLVLIFLLLHAPDLAIVQIVVETLSLVILIAAILKTTREDTEERLSLVKTGLWVGGLFFVSIFMYFTYQVLQNMAEFGAPNLRMAVSYLEMGLKKTGAANLVGAVILDFRGYDTLGEATVLFTSVMGVLAVLRKIGRKKEGQNE